MLSNKSSFRLVHILVLFSLLFSACGGANKNENSVNHEEYQSSNDNTANTGENYEANEYEYANDSANNNSDYYAPEPAAERAESNANGSAAPAATSSASSQGIAAGDSPYQHPEEDEEKSSTEDSTFQDYGTNPFVDTDHDSLSTFAMDVDTGSYTIARNYLTDYQMPPANAIRVEEFVNYFEQGYRQPKSNQTFAIYLDGGKTPFTENDNYQMLRVGIQGMEVSNSERDDLVLTFVIDVSGSMEQDGRLEIVKDALALLVDELRRSDTVSIIAYSDQAWVVLEPTSGRDHNQIMNAIEELHPTFSTNAEAGLRLGYKFASRAFESDSTNRVILLSDGVANVGATGPDSIWESIDRYAKDGIYLTTVGVGMGNYNDVLLEQLADQGDGAYTYVDSLDEAERLFVDDFTGTLQTIAKDAKTQITFNPDVVERYRLIGYENREIADEDFNDPSVDAGEIGAGHSVTALYEIKLYDHAKGIVATATIHWEDPKTGRLYEIEEDIHTRDLETSFTRTSSYFQQAVIVAEFAEILRDSYFAEDTSLTHLQNVAEEVLWDLEGNSQSLELLDLIDTAVWVSDY